MLKIDIKDGVSVVFKVSGIVVLNFQLWNGDHLLHFIKDGTKPYIGLIWLRNGIKKLVRQGPRNQRKMVLQADKKLALMAV